ncbi:phosphotransferase [Pseudomonas lopnurensis]|uniref:phosphotransferase n=1 Tax=Pseudomonas lopnurensis TaxID=1477517 RepID=UPI0028B03AB3|nr:phosphotransferase [Pseudomonas lopnurensis]
MSHGDPLANGKPYPARAGRLPRHLDEITPDWLSSLLRHRYPGIKVESFEVIQVRNGHTTKLRLALELNEAGRAVGIPRHVCLKSNWSEGFESGEICELEARFYQFMRDRPHTPMADSYFCDWDDDGGGRGVVVMEDLALAPGQFGHSTHHLGVDGVAKGLESLASLHAALWGSAELDAQRWLPVSMEHPIDCDQLLRNYNYMRLNLRKPEYHAFLPGWLYETPELFAQAFDELAAFELRQDSPRCLVHGDSHQGNSFLRDNGERVWLDWQLVRKGRPWRDIAYFMLGALTVEERRASAGELLRHYRETLIGLGADGVLDQDAAWDQLRRWPLYGMQAWLANVDEWGQDGRIMVERFFAAAEDFESIRLLTEGRKPQRAIRLGEGARQVLPHLRALLED